MLPSLGKGGAVPVQNVVGLERRPGFLDRPAFRDRDPVQEPLAVLDHRQRGIRGDGGRESVLAGLQHPVAPREAGCQAQARRIGDYACLLQARGDPSHSNAARENARRRPEPAGLASPSSLPGNAGRSRRPPPALRPATDRLRRRRSASSASGHVSRERTDDQGGVGAAEPEAVGHGRCGSSAPWPSGAPDPCRRRRRPDLSRFKVGGAIPSRIAIIE